MHICAGVRRGVSFIAVRYAWHACSDLPCTAGRACYPFHSLSSSLQGLLPRLEPFRSASQSGALEWRCDRVHTLKMATAGIGCVMRAFCSGLACSPEVLGLWRDPSLILSGALGGSLSFSELQCGLDRLRHVPEAPAGAVSLRHMRGFTGGWGVLELSVGVYIFGAWLRKLSGAHHPHAVCYNAEMRVLYLGMATLIVSPSDLADLASFVEAIEMDYGVYCRDHTDARRVYVTPAHTPGVLELPIFPPEQFDGGSHKRRRRQ